MGLAYAVVVQDMDGADSNVHVGTRQETAHNIFEEKAENSKTTV